MKKKISIILLAMLMLAVFGMNTYAEEFVDMPNNWAREPLENAIKNGLLKGDGGRINPEGNLTRAELATILNRALGINQESDLSRFIDLETGKWYYNELAKSVNSGLLKGDGNKLNPNKAITRQEAFVIISRALELEENNDSHLKFNDGADVANWAVKGIDGLINKGYLKGNDGSIRPKGNITRAEFASLMNEIVKTYISDAGLHEEVVKGNIIINSPTVELKNLKVDGDLIIGEGALDDKIILNNVEVSGRILVRGSGELIIKNKSDLDSILVSNRTNRTIINIDENSKVENIDLKTRASIDGEGKVGEVVVNAGADGSEILIADAKVDVDSSIKNVLLAGDEKKEEKKEENKEDKKEKSSSRRSGGGGGGGGSSSGSGKDEDKPTEPEKPVKPVEPATPAEELKNNFIEEAKKQESTNKEMYSLNFDGKNLNVVFTESKVKENPGLVLDEAVKVLEEMFKTVDKATVSVNGQKVEVTKENPNTRELAEAFLGELELDKFLEGQEVAVDFSAVIEKDGVVAELEGMKSSFSMNLDLKKAEELKNNFIEEAKKQESTNKEMYSLNFDGKNLNVVFTESKVKENPGLVLDEAVKVLEEMFKTVDKATVSVNGKEVEVTKENPNTRELAEAFLGELELDKFLEGQEVAVDFSAVIEKDGVVAELDEMNSSFSMNLDLKKAEELKNNFIEEAKKQESTNKEMYSLNFDGKNLNVVFTESKVKENPGLVLDEAVKVLEEMFKTVDKATVSVNGQKVEVTKENPNTRELAEAFLGELELDKFLEGQEVAVDFSAVIEKDGVVAELDEMNSSFSMNLDLKKAEELKNNFIEEAKKQESTNEEMYSLNFNGEKLEVTFKESGLEKDPVKAVKTAANAMLDEVLKVIDEATITVNGEEVRVSKENKNIEALAKAFLGETGVEDFINNGKVEVSFTTKISKGDVKDVEVGEVSATFAMDMDSTREAAKKEELKKSFLDAAEAQKSLDENIYSLNFDGEKLGVTFKESGLEKDPVKAVKTAANAMLDEVLKVVDEATITVNKEEVIVSKENKNIEALAKAFLGETGVEDFINNGKVEVSFTTKISKGDVKDVEVGEVSATFAMDMDSTREAAKKEELKKAFLTAAEAQKSLDENIYSLNFDGEKLGVTFKESGLKKDPVEAVKTAANAMLDEVLKVVDEATITVNKEEVIVSKENKNIEALAKAFLGETGVEDFINNGKVEVSFTTKISKGDVKDVEVGEVSATFAMDMDSSKEEAEKEEEEAEQAEKERQAQVVAETKKSIEEATSVETLEAIKIDESLSDANKSVLQDAKESKKIDLEENKKIEDGIKEDYDKDKEIIDQQEQTVADYYIAQEVVDQITALGEISLESKEAVEAVRAAYNALTEAQQKFVDNLDTLEGAEAKLDNLRKAALADLKKNIDEFEATVIRLLNKQGRFHLEKVSDNEVDFEFITNGNTFGGLGSEHDTSPATEKTSMKNYTRGSGLATVLGQKSDVNGKAQKERIEVIKKYIDMDTATIDGESFGGLSSMSKIYSMKVGDFLGTKTGKVKVKDEIAEDMYLEYTINFSLPENK